MQTLNGKILEKKTGFFFCSKENWIFYNITVTRILNSNDLKRIFQYILPSSRKKYSIFQKYASIKNMDII